MNVQKQSDPTPPPEGWSSSAETKFQFRLLIISYWAQLTFLLPPQGRGNIDDAGFWIMIIGYYIPDVYVDQIVNGKSVNSKFYSRFYCPL